MKKKNCCAEWIEDLLGAARDMAGPRASCLMECCGKYCAARHNILDETLLLRNASSHCRSRSDYVEFLNQTMSIAVTESADGIIIQFRKDKCTCELADELSKNADMLCECSRGHEKAVWSIFFGKSVEVEIVESILRGGHDCILKIYV